MRARIDNHLLRAAGISLQGMLMKREVALARLDRLVQAVRAGKVGYRVLQVVVYGSVAKGAAEPNDIDLYVQLDKDSVPEEEIMTEVFGRGEVGRKIRKALKESRSERLSIEWSFEPWSEYRLRFPKPDQLEQATREKLSTLDLTLKTHRQARTRLEGRLDKRRAGATEWPPLGVVLFESAST